MRARHKTVGVIGGMGPEATVDFLRRVVAATPAKDDADHIRILVDNNPRIPSRIAALIEGGGEDPAPVLCAMAKGLQAQGADFLVMPCNTAHHYLPQIAEAVSIPLLDMVSLSVGALSQARASSVTMLASPAVRLIGLYKSRLLRAGMDAIFPDGAQEEKLLGVIRAVKAGLTDHTVRRDYAEVAASVSGDAYLIACTELSVLGPLPDLGVPCVDALDVLVNATIAEALG